MKSTLLRAFRHPLILTSVVLLAVNDQVLKSTAPSWLTGKLSDFAGLFFFPFLLGAFVQAAAAVCSSTGILPVHPGSPDRPAGKIPALRAACFALTGLAFAGVKTTPAVNAAVTALFPYPVQIILDPTDLLALVMFWPAWVLWASIEQRDERAAQKPAGKWAYLALGAASLASLATAACPPPVAVVRLAEVNGTLYAGVTPNYDQKGYTQVSLAAFSSADQGRTWTAQQEVPENVRKALGTPAELPITACDPQRPQVCYRISNTSQVEASKDGGKSWQVSWQIPPGREAYMDRAAGKGIFMACWKTPDRHPYDILFVNGTTGQVVVIAMGNEGVLRMGPSGIWERIDVEANRGPKIGPTPFYANDLWIALGTTGPEFWGSLIAGFAAYLLISLWAWITVARRHKPGARVLNALWPLLIPLVVLMVYCIVQAAILLLPQRTGDAFSVPLGILILLMPLMLLLAGALMWYTFGSLVMQPGRFRVLFLAAVGTALGLFLVAWLPFILWALGPVNTYPVALAMAIGLGLAVVVLCAIGIRRGLRRAVEG